MKRIWDTYFYWNKTERRGVVPLLVLIFILTAANIFTRNHSSGEVAEPDVAFLARAREFRESKIQTGKPGVSVHDGNVADIERKYVPAYTKTKYKIPAAPFDPNDLPKAGWVQLGLSDKQSESIMRFREKGGRFYKKEDLKKMYVVSEEFYAHIEPYLLLNTQERKAAFSDKPYAENADTPIRRVDINTADSLELVSLRGITPKMVQRILSVRETFGGFHSLEQVKDLYGFYEPNFSKLSTDAYLSPVIIKPININYCTFKELLKVPGLDYERVKNIMNHRQRVGSFKKTEELLTLNLAEPDLYAKIAPYLTVR